MLIALLVSIIANVGNDYLAPYLDINDPAHYEPPPITITVTDQGLGESRTIDVSVPEGGWYLGAPWSRRAAPGSVFTATITTRTGEKVVITAPVNR